MLEIKNLIKVYNGLSAVNNISFEIRPGEIFGLLGPNGAGKSSTIKIILRILKPTSGLVLLNGKVITDAIQSKTGYLPEERGLYKKSKVIDVLRYFGELKGLTKQSALEEAKWWLKRLDIEKYYNRNIEELSKGNQQKVQFITAVLHDPEILILDEPFSGFDPVNQQIIKGFLKEFADQGKIIIISTHMMDTAEELCRNILIINEGKEVLKGSVRDIRLEHSNNTYEIGFTGDVSQLNCLGFLEVEKQLGDRALVRPRPDIDAEKLLDILMEKVRINHFAARKPSLHDIYIQAVKGCKPEDSMATT